MNVTRLRIREHGNSEADETDDTIIGTQIKKPLGMLGLTETDIAICSEEPDIFILDVEQDDAGSHEMDAVCATKF